MPTHSTRRLELGGKSGMAIDHDHQNVEEETTYIKVRQNKELSCHSASPEFPTPVTYCSSLDIEVTAEPSFTFLRQLSKQTIWACANVIAARWPESIKLKTSRDAEVTEALPLENVDQTTQQRPQTALFNTLAVSQELATSGDSEIQHLRVPYGVCATTSDNGSIFSNDSKEENEYNLMAIVEGHKGEVLISVDSQAPRSFIVRPALDELGECREYSIPVRDSGPEAYTSPLNPEESIVPTKFVKLKLHMYQIGEQLKIKLIIFEVPKTPNGFQVILGRDAIRMLGGWKLFRRIEEANAEGTNAAAAVNNSFAPIRRAKKSKKQVEVHNAKDRELQERQRREHARLYQDGRPAPPPSAGPSMPNALGISYQGPSQQTEYYLSGLEYSQPAAWQYSQKNVAQLANEPYLPIQRTDTSSTQFTHFSFTRQDSSSSISSWPSVVAPKEGEPASDALTTNAATGFVSNDNNEGEEEGV